MTRMAFWLCTALAIDAICGRMAAAQSNGVAPLQLEAKIPLGNVRGRIDHMAVDIGRRRLFVAELGNDTVGIIDLDQRQTVKMLEHLKEPQGVGYFAATDTLFVANGGDGSVRLFQGADYKPSSKIDLGSDADNLRVDQASGQVVVGYGSGALALIDATARSKIADIRLQAHPESFQLNPRADRAYVNVPNARSIATVDLAARKQIANWPTGGATGNFPMALDDAGRVLVMFRNPPKLGVFNMRDGSAVAAVDACGDSDDVFVDTKRRRIYASCGSGALDIFDAQTYQQVARVPTASGARTSLFVPEMDRLFLAVRAAAKQPAAIWVFQLGAVNEKP